jgi:TATA-box binding protein (TBP) (component of TFIID and TFIIIB)
MQSEKPQIQLQFSPYRVSTITCNADIGQNINIDLHILFRNIEICDHDYSFIWIQYLKENNENVRGLYPKKKRKSKIDTNKKNRFDNQMTVIYKYNQEYMPNIKIFKNGNIQLTGIKDFKHPEFIINKIIDNIKRIYNTIDKNIIITDDKDLNPLERLEYGNFKVRMINTDFKIYTDIDNIQRFNIKRKELHNILISDKYRNKSSFQPGVYQGVKLEYFWNIKHTEKNGICNCSINCFGKGNGDGNGNCKKVTIAIFESGSILITGGVTFDQVDAAYKFICNIITENKDTIKKQSMEELMELMVI